MIDPARMEQILRALPLLQDADPELRREFQEQAFVARIPAGRDVFVEGEDAQAIALLTSGVVRVYRVGLSGREITLYRFGLGESCILTANAILNREAFPAIATVEQQAEAVMIPADAFREWVGRHDFWREFVFDLLSQRLVSVMTLVDEVAFGRMDARVATFILERSQEGNRLEVTHQEIAAELGSAREVVSRILERFAQEGLVELARGTLDVLSREGLAERARM